MTLWSWDNLRIATMWLDSHAEWVLAGGLIAAAIVNWLQWHKDNRAVQRLKTQPIELPILKTTPRVSILIPAWNEAANIGSCLESILTLRYPDKEIVVCAGGDDGTLNVARRYINPDLTVLEQYQGEGKQRALQRCFERATGQIIFLTDADCQLDDNCFERTIAPLITEGEHVATGSRRPMDEQLVNTFVAYQWFHHVYLEGTLPEYIEALFGINTAIRREALERIGGFTAEAPIGTDYHLCRQLLAAGYRLRFVRDSRVQTDYQTSPLAYLRQQSRWFRNRFVYGIRFRVWGQVVALLRAGLAAIFMLGVPLTVGFRSRLLWYPWMAAACHLTFSQVRLIRFTQGYSGLHLIPHRRYALFVPYMVIGWIAMARGLMDSLLLSRREQW